MAISVRIPTQLRELTGGNKIVEAEGNDLSEIIENLEKNYPGIKDRLLDESGNLRRFVNIFLSDEDVRFLDGLNTKVSEGQTVSIIPAVAGG
jgi:molybdopterin synthase sulfur carrier subunit